MNSAAIATGKLLVIGDIARGEFREAFGQADANDRLPCSTHSTIVDAIEAIKSGAAPEQIVLACSWPGEFSAAEVEQLRRAAPLVNIVAVLGSWCQGTNRGYYATPLSIGWSAWPTGDQKESVSIVADRAPLAFASTATAEDLLLARAAEPIEQRQGTILLVVKSRSLTEALADACQLRGYETCLARPSRIGAAAPRVALAIVWDTTAEAAADAGLVATIRRAGKEAPVIALLDFPKSEEVDRALAAGIAAVVPKPLLIDYLYAAINRATA